MRPLVLRLSAAVPMALLSAALVLASGVPLKAAEPLGPPPAGYSATPGVSNRVERLLDHINRERRQRGLPRLRLREGLHDLARAHSRRMAQRGQLLHTYGLGDRVCCWRAVAENVGYAPTVRDMHRVFMNSPAHRRNVLGPGYRHIGLGVVRSRGYVWVTEVFRRPR